jgi:hypothetical protein
MSAAARKANGHAGLAKNSPESVEKVDTRPSPLAALTLRCWARARLFAEGEISLHDAVDVLWHAAERDGLVKQLGTDQVQQILADTFAAVR